MKTILRFDLEGVPCAVALPNGETRGLPLCLFLYGGSGSRETLAEIAPLIADLPLVVATPDVGPWSFYLAPWDAFIVDTLIPHLRVTYGLTTTSLVGISMGGYGALAIAFAQPQLFSSVAVVSPMIEPHDAPPRNRYHYPPEVPAHRPPPRPHSGLSSLAISIDAAGNDVLNAHDGAEALHRELWALDVPHEYRLRRDADHIGPDLVDRLREAFAWVTRVEPPIDPSVAALRAQLEPLRRAVRDPTMSRRYGVL